MLTDTETRVVPLLRPQEVAERLAVREDQVYRLVRSGALRAVRIGKLVRVTVAEVERFIEQGGSRNG